MWWNKINSSGGVWIERRWYMCDHASALNIKLTQPIKYHAQGVESSGHMEKLAWIYDASCLMKALTSLSGCFFFPVKTQVYGTLGAFLVDRQSWRITVYLPGWPYCCYLLGKILLTSSNGGGVRIWGQVPIFENKPIEPCLLLKGENLFLGGRDKW